MYFHFACRCRKSSVRISLPPPGYGVAGAGNAVFSVSSFMDVLEPAQQAVPA